MFQFVYKNTILKNGMHKKVTTQITYSLGIETANFPTPHAHTPDQTLE